MNKTILRTLNRRILFISILIALTLIFISYVIALHMSGSDLKVLNMNNLGSAGNGTGINSLSHNTETTLAPEENDNIPSKIVPNNCLGSALCPD